jgi:hypothetical protein
MKQRFCIGVLFGAILLSSLAAFAGDKDKDKGDHYSELTFTVLRDSDGKPLENVSVVLHALDKKGHVTHGGFQLKTNRDGVAIMPSAPYGRLRLQVLYVGYQTYGQDIDVNQPQQSLTVRLKPPAEQFSIYK